MKEVNVKGGHSEVVLAQEKGEWCVQTWSWYATGMWGESGNVVCVRGRGFLEGSEAVRNHPPTPGLNQPRVSTTQEIHIRDKIYINAYKKPQQRLLRVAGVCPGGPHTCGLLIPQQVAVVPPYQHR